MSPIVTLIAAAHLGHFKTLDDIARAKAEIFEGVEPGGVALINRDDQRWALLAKMAKEAGVEKVVGFGEHAKALYRLINLAAHPDHSLITAAHRRQGDQCAHRRARPAHRAERARGAGRRPSCRR